MVAGIMSTAARVGNTVPVETHSQPDIRARPSRTGGAHRRGAEKGIPGGRLRKSPMNVKV